MIGEKFSIESYRQFDWESLPKETLIPEIRFLIEIIESKEHIVAIYKNLYFHASEELDKYQIKENEKYVFKKGEINYDENSN